MSKKVISFSLFGKHPTYTLGAIANARHAKGAYFGLDIPFLYFGRCPQI